MQVFPVLVAVTLLGPAKAGVPHHQGVEHQVLSMTGVQHEGLTMHTREHIQTKTNVIEQEGEGGRGNLCIADTALQEVEGQPDVECTMMTEGAEGDRTVNLWFVFCVALRVAVFHTSLSWL